MSTSTFSTVVYGPTSRATSTTSIIAAPNDRSIGILYPRSTTTESLQTPTAPLPPPVSGSSSPDVLPTMGVVDIAKNQLNTGTLAQASPIQSSGAASSDRMNVSQFICSAWSCWPKAQQAGTAVAIALAIIGIFGVLIWGLWWKPRAQALKENPRTGDEEGGRMKRRGPIAAFLLGKPKHAHGGRVQRQRRRHRRSRRRRCSSSAASRSSSCSSIAEVRVSSRVEDPPMVLSPLASSENMSMAVTRHRPMQAGSHISNMRSSTNHAASLARVGRRSTASMPPSIMRLPREPRSRGAREPPVERTRGRSNERDRPRRRSQTKAVEEGAQGVATSRGRRRPRRSSTQQ